MEQSKVPATVTTVAKINGTDIVVIENGEKRVAVKPICQALGINYTTQLERLQKDPILSSSIVPLKGTVAADGKQREMITIPFKFVFGWLFRIDNRNVKPEARDAVMQYQLECYNALYNHFTELDDYLKFRDERAGEVWQKVEMARDDFKLARNRLEAYKKEFAEFRAMTFEKYREQKRQLALNFQEEGGTQ